MNEDKSKPEPVRWDDLAAFLSVAQAGGLAAAAKNTNISAPTLGRRMHKLERALERELFVRRTHGYDLTDAGAELVQELGKIAGQIGKITAQVSKRTMPLVKISAGTWTELALVRRHHDIVGNPPDVRLRFVSSEEVLSISRREISIAIRNQRPTEIGVARRKLARNEFAVYATPEAPPNWIVPTVNTPSARWVREQMGQDLAHEVGAPRIALDLALVGAGQIVLPTFIGDTEQKLERRSALIPELAHDAWLVAHDDDRHLPEVRRVISRIYEIRS